MIVKKCPSCQNEVPSDVPEGLCPTCLLESAQGDALSILPAPDREVIANAFPQLTELELIGQGGMGFIYKALQPELDRTIALKILSPELGKDPAFTERFAREARVLGKLNHPHIVTIFEHGENDGFFYLMMEFVDGVNLREAMLAQKFTPEQALAIIPDICDALQSAHDQGIWHRDIKPENILLDQDGKVKIADFGIARIIGDRGLNFTLTTTGNALGSAPYMSPEQHEDPHKVDHRADIYSLGVVLYEMLTGELPLGRFPPPSERASVDQRIDELVLRTLEKERELRQQSAAQIKTDIAHMERNKDQTSQVAPLPANAIAPISLRGLTLFLGGTVLALVAGPLTTGNTQGILLSIAAVIGIAGFVMTLVALTQMRRGEIPVGLRWSLRSSIILLAGLFLIIVTLRQKPSNPDARALQEEVTLVKKAKKSVKSVSVIEIHRSKATPAEISGYAQMLVSDKVINKSINDYSLDELFKIDSFAAREQIRNSITIKQVKGSNLFQVEVLTDSKQKAQQISCAVLQTYNTLRRELARYSFRVVDHQKGWSNETAKMMQARCSIKIDKQQASKEEIHANIIEMNRLAHLADYKKFALLISSKEREEKDLVNLMSLFFGEIEIIKEVSSFKPEDISEPDPSGLPSKPIMATSQHFIKVRKSDGSLQYVLTFFDSDGRLAYFEISHSYRGVYQVRLTPNEGLPLRFLETNLPDDYSIEAVDGEKNLFHIISEGFASYKDLEDNHSLDSNFQSLKKLLHSNLGAELTLVSTHFPKHPWIVERYDPEVSQRVYEITRMQMSYPADVMEPFSGRGDFRKPMRKFVEGQLELIVSDQTINRAINDYQLDKLFNTDKADLLKKIKNTIRAEQLGGTDLIQVEVFHENKEQAQQISYAIVHSSDTIRKELAKEKGLEIESHTVHERGWSPEVAKTMEARKKSN